MEKRYALQYRGLYERHWWWRAREEVILATLDRWKSDGGSKSILDVGCGDGLFFEKLQRFGPVDGIEMDRDAVTPGGPWAGRIHVGPFDETFEPHKQYSLILMLDVLEHFQDSVAALGRAKQLLEPRGVVLLTVPAFPILWTSHDDLNRHCRRYTRASLKAEAEAAGLSFLCLRYFFRWVAPLKLAVRGRELLFGATAETPGIPPRWLNRMLYQFSRAEERALRSFPVPFGGSILGVAQARKAAS